MMHTNGQTNETIIAELAAEAGHLAIAQATVQRLLANQAAILERLTALERHLADQTHQQTPMQEPLLAEPEAMRYPVRTRATVGKATAQQRISLPQGMWRVVEGRQGVLDYDPRMDAVVMTFTTNGVQFYRSNTTAAQLHIKTLSNRFPRLRLSSAQTNRLCVITEDALTVYLGTEYEEYAQ